MEDTKIPGKKLLEHETQKTEENFTHIKTKCYQYSIYLKNDLTWTKSHVCLTVTVVFAASPQVYFSNVTLLPGTTVGYYNKFTVWKCLLSELNAWHLRLLFSLQSNSEYDNAGPRFNRIASGQRLMMLNETTSTHRMLSTYSHRTWDRVWYHPELYHQHGIYQQLLGRVPKMDLIN